MKKHEKQLWVNVEKQLKKRINQITFSIEDEKHIIKVINDEAGEELK